MISKTYAQLALISLAVLLCSTSHRSQADDSREAFAKVRLTLIGMLDRGDIDDAVAFLEKKISASEDARDLIALRHLLASRMIDKSLFKEAIDQYTEILQYQIDHSDRIAEQYGIWATVRSMNEIKNRSGKYELVEKSIDHAHQVLTDKVPANDLRMLMPVSQVALMKAHQLASRDNEEAARKIVDAQVKKLAAINESDSATDRTMLSYVRLMLAATSDDAGNRPWRDEYVAVLDKVAADAIERFPESRQLQNDYATTQHLMITQWGQEDPEATKQRIETTMIKLEQMAFRNRSVQSTLRRIESYQRQMFSKKPVNTLIGKPAPEWTIDAWVNAGDITRESLAGKVVMLDFWAMWCGPCIRTFPHLREWREEFGDKGFEIVGVTQYYNYRWDEDAEIAKRSENEVAPEDEREAIAKFLDSHQLEHPTILTPEGSEMAKEFGVQGIPHVVLIDRDGIVRLVKTGGGEATAAEIASKIRDLLAGADGAEK